MYKSQNMTLLVYPDTTFFNCLWIKIQGTFAIIRMNAIKFTTFNMPATTYSWNKADSKKVMSIQFADETPRRLHG